MRSNCCCCCWLLPLAFVACLMTTLTHAASGNNNNSNNNRSGIIADAELSASERNRRLIPYMAFYLPAPELPINQQYAVKHAPSAGSSQLRPPPAGASAPTRIPVPVAYMPQTHPHPHPPQHSHPHQHHLAAAPVTHYQPGAADIYHALAIGGHQQQQHPLPPHPPVHPKETSPAEAGGGATFIAYKPLNPTHKHKTVQHFPPLPQQQEQQQQQQQQEQHGGLPHPPQLQLQLQFPRQRGKHSKLNLTPFTAQNTLPGHFIPIIYTPVSKPNINNNNNNNIIINNNNNELHNGNTISYNKKQPATEIVYHKNSHQTPQIVTDASGEQQQQQQQPEQLHPTPSAGYNLYNEPAVISSATSSSSASLGSSKTALIVHQKSPLHGHVSKYESYFNMAPDQQQLTPQEKYVLYLQQRMKQQRYQHQHHHGSEDVHHQPAQSNTKAGKHSHNPHPQSPPPAPPSPSTHHSQLHNYNGVFLRPEPNQQVLHIPLRALMGPHHLQPEQPERQEYAKEPLLGSPAPPQFIDYLIDGPRQSLEEEQQQQQHHQQQQQHQQQESSLPAPSRQPQHAFILVTTSTPYTDDLTPPTRAPAVLYKQQPTLRLQPVSAVPKYKATRRPVYITPPTPSETVKITPKYVYVSSKPPPVPSELPTAPPPVKLKPVFKYAPERPQIAPRPSQVFPQEDTDQLPDIRTSSLAEILHKLQASNHLPQTLTPDNIDNSIKTLIRILQNLKQTQTIVPNPPQHHETKPSSSSNSNSHDYDYNTDPEEEPIKSVVAGHVDADLLQLNGPNKHPGPSTGRPGIDYPNYAEIPKTNFECTQQRYKGFFGDPETNCQVWHYCDLNGGKASFLCPNGTIFSQIALTCDWWFNVKCSTTSQLYVLNERLYKYILPFNPKFPEDYNGPIVDKYLAMKFQEMEEKMRLEKQRKASQAEKPVAREESSTPALPKNHKASAKQGSGINAQVYEQSSERNLLIDDEIDDISERGTYDTYEQSPTTVMAPTAEDSQTLGLRPIFVSSTPEPELDVEPEPQTEPELDPEPVSSEAEDKLQSLRDTNSAAGQKKLETTKVSVEKLEVIEIKADGNTGHLMPLTEQARANDSESDNDSE